MAGGRVDAARAGIRSRLWSTYELGRRGLVMQRVFQRLSTVAKNEVHLSGIEMRNKIVFIVSFDFSFPRRREFSSQWAKNWKVKLKSVLSARKAGRHSEENFLREGSEIWVSAFWNCSFVDIAWLWSLLSRSHVGSLRYQITYSQWKAKKEELRSV